MKNCPYCGSEKRIRKNRKGIARYFNFLKFYNCLDCRKNYYWIDLLQKSYKLKHLT